MFRDTDVDTMKDYGLDLSSYDEVKNKVQAIYATLAEGTMPCDRAWPKDRVATGFLVGTCAPLLCGTLNVVRSTAFKRDHKKLREQRQPQT
jgi:hypothetical protein